MKTGNNEWKRAIGLTFALLVLGVVVLFYCDWRGTFADTAYVCRKSLWALPVFAVLLSLFYYFEIASLWIGFFWVQKKIL